MDALGVSRDEHGVVTLTINRPHRKNAITRDMWYGLIDVFDEVADRRDDRVLVITGAGDAFTSGADLTDPGDGDGGENVQSSVGHALHSMRLVGRCALRLHEIPKPTIAAVNGVAVGAGCNLALGCDLIVASDAARFCEIFPRRGLSLDFGGSWILPRLVGLHRAKELAFLGDMVSAAEAREIGLVNRVVPAADFDAAVDELAHRVAAMAPIQVSIIKRQLNQSFSVSMSEALEFEDVAQSLAFASRDSQEAMHAFVERREPRFTGD